MKQEKPKIYERKDGMVKIYNGHLGTFVWEKEEPYNKQKAEANPDFATHLAQKDKKKNIEGLLTSAPWFGICLYLILTTECSGTDLYIGWGGTIISGFLCVLGIHGIFKKNLTPEEKEKLNDL